MSAETLSPIARATLLSLQGIASDIAAVQTRLATGRKVNSAIDNPSAFFTASTLRTRAATLNNLMDDVGSVQKTVQAANTGITAIQSLLTSAQSIANQALESPNTYLTVTGTLALTTATSIESLGGSGSKFKAGDQVTVSDGTTTATYTAAGGDTVQTFLDAINNTAGLKVTASLNASGKIELQASDPVNVTLGATLGGAGTLSSILGLTAGTTSYVTNTTRQSLAQQFDAILAQIDTAAQDASYNGTNLLTGGSATATFNETGTSKLTINGADVTSGGLGLANSTGQFQSETDINAAITAVKSAISTGNTQADLLASNSSIIDTRQTFSKALADTLTSGADNLVLSDSNADSALLLSLQTRQQIAASVLSMTQSQNPVLRLFGLG